MLIHQSLQPCPRRRKEISSRIKYELGVTVSIGVSWNKIFAKLGSDYKKPDAITEFSKDNYKDIAWKLPVGDLLMVGRSTERKKAYEPSAETVYG